MPFKLIVCIYLLLVSIASYCGSSDISFGAAPPIIQRTHIHISPKRFKLPFIFWMHIQKTSSWLDSFLAVWACPDACNRELTRRNITIHDSTIHVNGSSIGKAVSDILYFQYLEEPLVTHTHEESRPHLHGHHIGPYRHDMIRKSEIWNCSVNFYEHTAGFGFHTPYDNKTLKSTVVTLFRKPISRVISAYLFDVMFPAGSPYKHPIIGANQRSKIESSSNAIYTYATTPGISSCQTKMMLGHWCGENVTLTSNQVAIAKARLGTDLYFFGLMEESEASANLFLAMHNQDGGNRSSRSLDSLKSPPFEFTKTRTNKKHSSSSHSILLKNLTESGWSDSIDDELYSEASRIFYLRCQQYQISTQFKSIDELMAHLHM